MSYILQFAQRDGEYERAEVLDEAKVSLAVGKHDLLEIVIQDRLGRFKRVLVTAVVQQHKLGEWR
jgi:hypothetical protein